MIVVGCEAANSFVKVRVPLSNDCYLNTCREVGVFEENLVDVDDDTTTVYTIGNKKYIVGDPDAFSSGGRDEMRYSSPEYKREMLIAIARNVQDNQELKLVTGLPAEDYKEKTLVADVTNNLLGTHTVFVNNEKVTFHIKKVHVMLQPLATLIHRIYDHNGHTRKGREQERYMKTLIIDVGFGTTDIVEVINMKPTRYIGRDIGMLNAMQYLEDYIKRDYPNIRGLPRGIALDNRVRENNTLAAGGQGYDIVKQKNEAFSRTANEVMNEVRQAGFNIKSYDKVLFTGGSVVALSDHLKSHLEGVNATRMSESQLSNANGYYTYGVIKL